MGLNFPSMQFLITLKTSRKRSVPCWNNGIWRK